mmetsp:Transcript_18135/g.31815  ORF Transcript_18135/g.31815 Transcript_18135/m.31815 type:complete len:210 (-) Transcript_18135:88-717(-)
MADASQDHSSLIAAAREAKAHGCCCSGCKLIWELKFALGFDIFLFTAVLGSLDYKMPLSFIIWMYAYLFGIVMPSAIMFMWVISNGNASGWPRRRLVQFLVAYKVPGYLLMYIGFIGLSPWSHEIAQFMCNPANNFEDNKMDKLFHHHYDKCVEMTPWIMIPACIPRSLIYMYSIKGALEYMRCHPENDGKGIFTSTVKAREYEPLLDA